MSTDDPSNTPADRDRREAVREKAKRVKVQQSRAHRTRLALLITGAVVVVAVIVGVVGWVVASAVTKPTADPQNLTDDGFRVVDVTGVTLESSAVSPSEPATATPTPTPAAAEGDSEATPDPSATTKAAVDIRVYVDYLSTGAKDFEAANVQQLAKWVKQDAATVTVYPVAMLTSKSNGTKYSLRAAGAAGCVATHAPEAFFKFNDALLAGQPSVDSDGLSDRELAALAIASGAESPKAVRSCIEDGDYLSWAKNATERALKSIPDTDGVALTGTPMILVNGKPYVGALDDPDEFAQYVLTVASDAYFKTASPTPTASATPTATP